MSAPQKRIICESVYGLVVIVEFDLTESNIKRLERRAKRTGRDPQEELNRIIAATVLDTGHLRNSLGGRSLASHEMIKKTYERLGSLRKSAEEIEIPYSTLRRVYHQFEDIPSDTYEPEFILHEKIEKYLDDQNNVDHYHREFSVGRAKADFLIFLKTGETILLECKYEGKFKNTAGGEVSIRKAIAQVKTYRDLSELTFSGYAAFDGKRMIACQDSMSSMKKLFKKWGCSFEKVEDYV